MVRATPVSGAGTWQLNGDSTLMVGIVTSQSLATFPLVLWVPGPDTARCIGSPADTLSSKSTLTGTQLLNSTQFQAKPRRCYCLVAWFRHRIAYRVTFLAETSSN